MSRLVKVQRGRLGFLAGFIGTGEGSFCVVLFVDFRYFSGFRFLGVVVCFLVVFLVIEFLVGILVWFFMVRFRIGQFLELQLVGRFVVCVFNFYFGYGIRRLVLCVFLGFVLFLGRVLEIRRRGRIEQDGVGVVQV